MSLHARRILQHHIKINGKKALIYGHILADVRYVELSTAIATLYSYGLNDLILDIGCGHSIFPTLIKSKTNIIVMDISLKALKWQINSVRARAQEFRKTVSHCSGCLNNWGVGWNLQSSYYPLLFYEIKRRFGIAHQLQQF